LAVISYTTFLKVCITGSKGLVGSVACEELASRGFEVSEFDLPKNDANNLDHLIRAFQEVDAVIHFAWDMSSVRSGGGSEVANIAMSKLVIDTAVNCDVGKLIFGSSNQAHGYKIVDDSGRISPHIDDDPENNYGRAKIEIENYLSESMLGSLALRIGNMTKDNKRRTDLSGPERWISHRDLGNLLSKWLRHQPLVQEMEVVKGAGVFGIEMLVDTNDEVMLNEVAPRVHNTGHITTLSAQTSQFENHVRAITGLPIGGTELVVAQAVMINILGENSHPVNLNNISELLRIAGPHSELNWYGKASSDDGVIHAAQGRKLGHINIAPSTVKTDEEIIEIANRARDAIRG